MNLKEYIKETEIDYVNDSLDVIRAKIELAKFRMERDETDAVKYPKIAAYHAIRIEELESIVNVIPAQ